MLRALSALHALAAGAPYISPKLGVGLGFKRPVRVQVTSDRSPSPNPNPNPNPNPSPSTNPSPGTGARRHGADEGLVYEWLPVAARGGV